MNLSLVDPTKIEFISIDPGKGRKDTIGVVTWQVDEENQASPLDARQFTLEEFEEFLYEIPTEKIWTVVAEEYVVSPYIKHGGSKVETIRVLGIIEHWCRRNKIKLVKQRNTILHVAQKWSGVTLSKDHSISHWQSAYNHGYFYLHQRGFIKARVLEND